MLRRRRDLTCHLIHVCRLQEMLVGIWGRLSLYWKRWRCNRKSIWSLDVGLAIDGYCTQTRPFWTDLNSETWLGDVLSQGCWYDYPRTDTRTCDGSAIKTIWTTESLYSCDGYFESKLFVQDGRLFQMLIGGADDSWADSREGGWRNQEWCDRVGSVLCEMDTAMIRSTCTDYV